ncbi:hypothetical protein BC829DRAFT_490176 [Chytridium lagenaria]|nr:hypothetical protein BC829DRAFT_490176 [Chytridium lagenaria]
MPKVGLRLYWPVHSNMMKTNKMKPCQPLQTNPFKSIINMHFDFFHGDDNIVRISEGMGAESIAIQRKIEWDSDEEDEIRKRLESVVVTFKDVVKEGKRMKVNERWTRRVEVIPLKRVVEEKGTLRDYLMKLKAQRRESAKPTPVIAEGASALMVRKRRQRLSQEKRRKKIAMKTGKTEIKKEVKKDAKKEVKKDQGLKKMKKIKIVKSGVKGLKELAVIYGRDLGCRGVVKGMDRVVAARLNANFTSQGYRPPFRPRMY